MAEMRAELVGLLIEKHGERAKIKLDKDKSKGEKYLNIQKPGVLSMPKLAMQSVLNIRK